MAARVATAADALNGVKCVGGREVANAGRRRAGVNVGGRRGGVDVVGEVRALRRNGERKKERKDVTR